MVRGRFSIWVRIASKEDGASAATAGRTPPHKVAPTAMLANDRYMRFMFSTSPLAENNAVKWLGFS